MRNLGFSDVFKVARILKKLDVKMDIQPGMTQEQLGGQMMLRAAENLGNAEAEVTDFVASMKGISKEDAEKMSFGDLVDFLEEFKKLPDIQRFFSSVSKLMK
ncbi:hypothetical protein BTR22_18665 [Alkalihalophilus pseudofirmus]|uniref:hypothetical protein n=1 Tax=Alkalihalophilus pseudofirmus TaxID=79885 RepID=UPI000951AFDA|nr:hypothetical protein BTR22_18665 [Alkalihalophilus pseudofirmus]